MTRLGRVAVIGVGMIGGSFALALKAAGACGHVAGAGRYPRNLARAKEMGAIDSIAPDAAAAARGADLVLVATPVAQFQAVFSAVAPVLAPGPLVTDGDGRMSSITDEELEDQVKLHLPEHYARRQSATHQPHTS